MRKHIIFDFFAIDVVEILEIMKSLGPITVEEEDKYRSFYKFLESFCLNSLNDCLMG